MLSDEQAGSTVDDSRVESPANSQGRRDMNDTIRAVGSAGLDPETGAVGRGRPLRVLCLYPAFDPAIHELAIVWKLLTDAGRVRCEVIAGSSDRLKGFDTDRMSVEYPNLVVRRVPGDLTAKSLTRDVTAAIAAFAPDLIVGALDNDLAPALRARALSAAPIVFHTEHWLEPRALRRRDYLFVPALRTPMAWLRRWRFGRHLAHVMVADAAEAGRIAALQAPERYSYLPWPHPVPAEAGPIRPFADRRRDTVVYIGSLARWKRASALAEYLVGLLRGDPATRVVVVGPALDDEARASHEAIRHAGGERAEFVKHLPRARALELIAGALCVFTPSDLRGWGLVGDAWNMGTPVVAAAEHYALRDGVTGLVASDPTALVAHVRALRSDQALWSRLVEAGLAHVRGEHAPQAVAERLLEILERVDRNARASSRAG